MEKITSQSHINPLHPLELFLINLKLKNDYYSFYIKNGVNKLEDALLFNSYPQSQKRTKTDELNHQLLLANIKAIRDDIPKDDPISQIDYLDNYVIVFNDVLNLTTEQIMKGFKPKNSKPNFCLPKQFQSQNITPSSIFSAVIQGKKIYRIAPLDSFQNLKHLFLNDNQIIKLENLSFPNLEILELSGNYIRTIEGMEHVPQLREINLERNCICIFEGFQMNNRLETVSLSNQSLPLWRFMEISPECVNYQLNIVSCISMEGCRLADPVNLGQFSFLKKLLLRDNAIDDMMKFLSVLKACVGIEEVDIRGNPFTLQNKTTYKNFIVLSLRNIIELDGKTVTDNEKAYVSNLFLRKFGKSKSINNNEMPTTVINQQHPNLDLDIKNLNNNSPKSLKRDPFVNHYSK